MTTADVSLVAKESIVVEKKLHAGSIFLSDTVYKDGENFQIVKIHKVKKK